MKPRAAQIHVNPSGLTVVTGTDVQTALAQLDSAVASGGGGGGGTGAGWTLLVDEAGTSLSNWTTVAGTWALDGGGYIKQTATTGYAGLRYNSREPAGAGLVMQADISLSALGGLDALRGFVAPASDAIVSGSHAPYGGLDISSGAAFQRGQQAVEFVGSAPTADTFYTVRATLLGGYLTIAINGTPVGTYTVNLPNDTRYDYPMLVAYKGEVRFKNIKLWRLDGPA